MQTSIFGWIDGKWYTLISIDVILNGETYIGMMMELIEREQEQLLDRYQRVRLVEVQTSEPVPAATLSFAVLPRPDALGTRVVLFFQHDGQKKEAIDA